MPYTAFRDTRRIAHGPLVAVALAVKAAMAAKPAASYLTFDDATGKVVDLDLRGSDAQIADRLAEERPRGRPKLGVVAREVTLLPRHWEWLAEQPGGASQTLRRLVDQARRNDGDKSAMRAARTAAYTFMAAMAGNRPHFEEAARALFAGDTARLAACMRAWPSDIRAYAQSFVEKHDADLP
jgi:hypothetical protein